MNTKSKINFEVSERKVLLRFFDITFTLGTLFIVGHLLNLEYLKVLTSHFYYAIVLAIYITGIGTIFEIYDLRTASNELQVIKGVFFTASITVVFYLFTPFLSAELPNNRFQILLFYAILLSSLLVWRILYVRFLASKRFFQNAILICDQEHVEELILGLETSDPHYKIIAYVNSDTIQNDDFGNHFVQHLKIDDLIRFAKDSKLFEIVIAKKTEDITVELYQKLLHLLESGTTIREYAQVYETKTYRIPIQYISRDFYKFLPFNRSNSNKLYLLNARIMEIFIASIGLSFGALLTPFIALINTFFNKGNLFYIQERVGKNGKIFQILKFRTMVEDADKSGTVFSKLNDSRVTPFGKFLRKTRIDEIPQFINILKGDMAVIGPRPERLVIVKEVALIMPFYETRHIIKPGITGWAQVNYSYGECIADSLIKLQYDLYYIKHRSVFLDFNITIKTISTILFYKGQ